MGRPFTVPHQSGENEKREPVGIHTIELGEGIGFIMKEIKVNRASVCLGDDMEDHARTIYMDDNATYEDLFRALIKEKYFPRVAGNNVVWVLKTEEYFCICSYYTLTDKLQEGLTEKQLSKICKSSQEIFLDYYASPLKWKEKIKAVYQDDAYSLWRDGWLHECVYCDYVMSLSQKHLLF